MDNVAWISVFIALFLAGVVMIPGPVGWVLVTGGAVGVLVSVTPARHLILTKGGPVPPPRPRDDLGAYSILGQALLRDAPSHDDEEFCDRVKTWTNHVLQHIEQNYGPAEVALFLDNTGMTSKVFNPMRDGIDLNKDRCKNSLSFRLQRLGELIKRLS